MHRPEARTKRHQTSPRAQWPLVTWILIAAYLLQPVLSYLATPFVAHNASGQTVVICTLQGSKSITLDIPAVEQLQNAEHCSALQLLHSLASTRPADPLPAMATLGQAVADSLVPVLEPLRKDLPSSYLTRAPPIV